jgi:4-hydroxybenzoyl-CoA reductase subunit alpha
MEEYNLIGKRLPRVDGIPKVTGEGAFTDDMSLPGMLYGKILSSPYPHAKILNIDISKALRVKGVKGIITGKNTLGLKYGIFEIPEFPANHQILAVDKVRYIGDEVAAVAAIDEDIAEEALELIKIDYEPLPAVFDPEEAMKDDAPKVHEDVNNNICTHISWEFGDLERGFKEADHIREDRFITKAISHCQIEPHAALANFDLSGKLTVWSATQSPYMQCVQLAKVLGMPESKVRVINPYVGGGFGGKVELMSYVSCAALLSKIIQKPVKIRLTREEVFTATRQKHPMIVDLKTGIKKDGRIVASKMKIIADGGAYTSTGPIAIFASGAFWVTLYKIPNVKYDGYRVFTNKPVRGARRGHGGPQPRFAAESQIDMLAEDLSMDAVEIRLKNALNPGDILPNRTVVTSCGLSDCIKEVARNMDFKKNDGKFPKSRGKGIGCSSFASGMLIPPHNISGALAKVQIDGGVTLLVGISEIGQGSDTIMSQIMADELGIGIEDIRITSGDTEITPPHAGSYSNRGTLWAGNAVKVAARDVKKQIFEVAASLLEANIEDLEAKDRRIYVKGSPGKGLSFKEVVAVSFLRENGNPILARGFYRPNIDIVDFKTGEGRFSPGYSFDTQGIEVEVDRGTGEVKILNMIIAHDCGIAINPMSVEGQIEGATISMGGGEALFEEVIMEDGALLNPLFLTYRIPTSMEMPNIKSFLIEAIDPNLPLGAKTSEGTLVSTCAAVANAIYNATGVRIKDLPITPEKILRELEKKGSLK